MYAIDMIILPVGCILCGMLAAAAALLRPLPILRPLIYSLIPYKIIIGGMTVCAGILGLLFPVHGPLLFGSFFPAAAGILTGLLISLEYFTDKDIIDKTTIIKIGNVLIYLKYPLGFAAILFGLLHFFVYHLPFL